VRAECFPSLPDGILVAATRALHHTGHVLLFEVQGMNEREKRGEERV
jgi:hypothetical protein